jgi:uncharacterized membrane-anchored protein
MDGKMAPFLKFPIMHRSRPDDLAGVMGRARLDRRTKNLTTRVCPGEIAIIDHQDLDRVSADALISRQVAAVLNVAPSISGRYPNLGPQLLVEAGVPLVDDAGPDVFTRVIEGDAVRLVGATLYLGDEIVAKGTLQSADTVAAAMAEAKAGVAAQIEAFVVNTLEYMKAEGDLLIEGIEVPPLRTQIEGRHALVVVRGYHHREDLVTLRPYIREFKPVMIGVDGGADALLNAGYRPHLIVGDMDSVSDAGLACGAELVVHAYPGGAAPGLARVERLGLPSVLCPAAGTSEDVALQLADAKGAALIVAVGSHNTLSEFLDKGRSGMASTFLTRLRLDSKLVDAKGVNQLYRSRISGWALLTLVLAALAAILAAVWASDTMRGLLDVVLVQLDIFKFWLTGLF